MPQETYQFTLTPQDSTLDERRIGEILEAATAEAVDEAIRDGYEVEAKTELQGGFGGLGEIAAALVFLAKSGAVAKLLATAHAGAAVAAKGLVEGASGAAGLAAALCAMHTNKIPPTINLDEPDPACDLDYVPNEAREASVRIALCNCIGFGSKNSALVVQKLDR